MTSKESTAVIVTTINSPNTAIRALSDGAAAAGWAFVVAGDTKTPADFKLSHGTYLSIDQQIEAFPGLCANLPTRHYARKNVAYLHAIQDGATAIIETDDDNIPNSPFWELHAAGTVDQVASTEPWFNAYSLFSTEPIWPRGLPLEYVRQSNAHRTLDRKHSQALLVQGLADDNPDVDAVYRLICKLPIVFDRRKPVMLSPGTWCPFNSQNTLFRKPLFPLLYLPSLCSFRMTDIWRSFIAQRCLWELGEGLIFTSASVYQERNEHSLLRDFEQEIPGYLQNEKIRRVLEPLALDKADMIRNLNVCYEALIAEGILPAEERVILAGWTKTLEKLG